MTHLLRPLLTRLLPLAALLAGCTVVVPDLHVTTVTVQQPAGSGPSLAPITPDPSPTATPVAAAPRARRFSGSGPAQRLGPITAVHGHLSIHVYFQPVGAEGAFRLQLLDREGFMVAAVADLVGVADTTFAPAIDLADDYYLSVGLADGPWQLDVESTP